MSPTYVLLLQARNTIAPVRCFVPNPVWLQCSWRLERVGTWRNRLLFKLYREVVKQAPLRTRCMAAIAYDAGLRREELCSLESSDLDPAHRLIRVRAEVAKGCRERVVPYSETSGELLRIYLIHRRRLASSFGP